MHTAVLTFIVPIYNVEDYLTQCLQSIASINRGDVEVILINDGSTDGSLKIAEKFLHNNKLNGKLISQPNAGLSAARNVGLEQATGEWIAFLDSDDYIDPATFYELITYAQESTSDVISFDGYRHIDDDGSNLDLYSKPNPFIDAGATGGFKYLRTLIDQNMTNTVTVWDKIYRRVTLQRINLRFINDIVHEDVPFTFTLMLSDIMVEHIPKKIIYYRQRQGSIMHTITAANNCSRVITIDVLLNLFKQAKISSKTLNGYIIFISKNVVMKGGHLPFSQIIRLHGMRISVKKRVMLLYISFLNVKNMCVRKAI